MSTEECEQLLINHANYDSDGDHGCWLEVDLTYPDAIHDLHDSFPLAPESQKVIIDRV